MIILAIDPGYERLGIAVLERNEKTKKDQLLFSECFKTLSSSIFSERLRLIGEEIDLVIKKYKPTILSIEKLFFTSNQKTAMGVAEARGVVIYEATRNGMIVCEYTPLQIKIATTGYGRSDKKQIISMIPKLIAITKEIKHDDEFDAIAAGITCLASYRP